MLVIATNQEILGTTCTNLGLGIGIHRGVTWGKFVGETVGMQLPSRHPETVLPVVQDRPTVSVGDHVTSRSGSRHV